jgi:putative Ca2+/H+ antiporter (TMEM165/GDT1 family)
MFGSAEFIVGLRPFSDRSIGVMTLFLITFATVFLSEMVGDKSLLTISALVSRFRALPVYCGVVVAFMGKMLAAVLFGHAIARLPATLVAATSALTFLAAALVIWSKKQESSDRTNVSPTFWGKTMLTAFAAIFLSEWVDAGQLSAAMLAAQYHAPFTIWFSGSLALATKGAFAVLFGTGLRRYLPGNALRYGAFACCLVMSVLSALKIHL